MSEAGSKKVIERETSRRVFAREFNDSDLQHGDRVDRSPNFIITPTGVVCNRIFVVGVLTEVENIGGEGQALYRARVADPTGVFTVYAGQYQPVAASFLSKAETPAYVAVVGKARVFNPEKGSFYTSIRPEEINSVEEWVRDRWVYHTARFTAERIRMMEKALSSGLRGAELTRQLSVLTDDAIGVSRAIDHYGVSFTTLNAYKHMIVEALSTIAGEERYVQEAAEAETAVVETDAESVIEELLSGMDEGKGVSYEELLEKAEKYGYGETDVDRALNILMDKGRCYEPKIGILRLIK
ncbi:hypothetical protein CUJ83_11435 [Methanocella sp. CWC-04]|uniref:Glycerol dehydrogenase n=1 Tax=Methanooceanicella nereidis TaxID=2052831 RepID=A0AAP2REZ2_9EURY|nr:hypothetical protein [Methanocella sp. CWC-04]MCD1295611.1 hypothetical protein [Methanocella sp. CWC-04]